MTLPKFQPQNPKLSNDPDGWRRCTVYSGAMAASYDKQQSVAVTGNQLGDYINDKDGGINLRQLDTGLNGLEQVDLDVRYGVPWSTFVSYIDAGKGAVLQGHSSVFVGTKFSSSTSVQHAIFVPPGWAAMDPAADGRWSSTYDRRVEDDPYPLALLRSFAAKLILEFDRYGRPIRRLGDGLAYAAFTRDRKASGWRVSIQPSAGNDKRQYAIFDVVAGIARFREYGYTGGFSAACTAPHAYATGAGTVSLVRIMPPSNKAGQYVRSKWAKEVYP